MRISHEAGHLGAFDLTIQLGYELRLGATPILTAIGRAARRSGP